MGEPLRWNIPDATWNDARNLTWNGSLPDVSPPVIRSRTVSLTTTEILGFAASVSQFMTENTAALTAKGVTVAGLITDLDTKAATANDENVKQEMLKAELKTQTSTTDAALQLAYDQASTTLDLVVGALGKTSDLGKQAARLRSDIRRGPNPPNPTPPTP